MTYRAKAVTQRDGSELAAQNCRMASIATGLDFETGGGKTSTGAQMRARQPDQSGGTDSGDAVIAWKSYGETLIVRDGRTFDEALRDLKSGRLVHLDVWHATTGGPCLSGTGRYGHSLVVAPEQSGGRWLVSDPWCLPAKWQWWEESKLRAGAERWGGMVYNRAAQTGGDSNVDIREAVLYLMSRFSPSHEADEDPDDTGGAGRILYTRTGLPPQGGEGDESMGIQSASGLVTNYRLDLPQGTDLFADSLLTDRVTSMSKAGSVVYVGSPMPGDPGRGKSRAVQVGTGAPYEDGVARPTILYCDDKYSPIAVPPPEPPVPGPAPDCTEEVRAALEARDEQWRKWALAGAPGHDEEPS